MLLPFHGGKKEVTWHRFTLDTRPYRGPVHSLDVSPYHTYIADGIITHNCLYRWAGADFSPLLAAEHRRVLPQSYRVPRQIQVWANGYAAHIQQRQPKMWEPLQIWAC